MEFDLQLKYEPHTSTVFLLASRALSLVTLPFFIGILELVFPTAYFTLSPVFTLWRAGATRRISTFQIYADYSTYNVQKYRYPHLSSCLSHSPWPFCGPYMIYKVTFILYV